jgi:LSD1 subclass zinc finger protein
VVRQALNPACPQCGGPVEVPEGATYVRCGYCSAESFVDLTGALLHQVLEPTVGRGRVPGLVRARALEAGWPDATLTDLDLVYEPVWEIESPDGRRLRIAARPGPQGRFARVELPGGERAFVEPGVRDASAEWIEPELAPESVAEAAARATGRPVAVKTLRLIHHPIFVGRIRVAGDQREFRADAVSGELLEVDWPVRATHRSRNRAWAASALMVAAVALLPLPIAAPVVIVIGGIVARAVWRDSTPTPAKS